MLNNQDKNYLQPKEYFKQFSLLWKQHEHRFFKFERQQYYNLESDDAYKLYQSNDIAGCKSKIEQQIGSQSEMYLMSVRKNTNIVRVRFVEFPISDYTKYEILSYNVSARFCEKILIVPATDTVTEIFQLNDFLLFDSSSLMILDYDDRGLFKGGWLFTGDDVVENYLAIAQSLIEKSLPLGVFQNSERNNLLF